MSIFSPLYISFIYKKKLLFTISAYKAFTHTHTHTQTHTVLFLNKKL